MDLFSLVLLVGAILGTAALLMEFHLHGWLQLIVAIICTFTVVFLGGAFFGREVAPAWAVIAGKILLIGGAYALCSHIAHAVRHSGGGHGGGGHAHGGGWGGVKAVLVWVVGISLVAAVVAYDPTVGFHVPTIPSPPAVTIPSQSAPPTAAVPVTPTAASSPAAAPAAPAVKALPAGTKVGPVGLPPVPCDGLSFRERQKRGC